VGQKIAGTRLHLWRPGQRGRCAVGRAVSSRSETALRHRGPRRMSQSEIGAPAPWRDEPPSGRADDAGGLDEHGSPAAHHADWNALAWPPGCRRRAPARHRRSLCRSGPSRHKRDSWGPSTASLCCGWLRGAMTERGSKVDGRFDGNGGGAAPRRNLTDTAFLARHCECARFRCPCPVPQAAAISFKSCGASEMEPALAASVA
jgi:hypothetical protein